MVLRRLVIATLVSAVLVGVIAPAAYAGSFSWYGIFVHRLVSRDYYASHGSQRIFVDNAICPGPGHIMRARVVEEHIGPDDLSVWQTLDCNPGGVRQRRWVVDSGTYHFDIEKHDTSNRTYSWSVEGRMYYP
jgi:hypothetical protein